MNRKFLRMTLIGLIALAALFSLWPALSAGLGLSVSVNSAQTDSATTDAALSHAGSSRGGCSRAKPGVTFIVDFGGSGANTVERYCASGKPTNGWTAFQSAGLKVTGTAQYPVGFVCRINGFPTKAHESCQETPNPTNGSWVYYIASAKTNNHGWQFAMVGASMIKPDCGDVQGWRFVKAQDGEKTKYPRAKPEPFKCAP